MFCTNVLMDRLIIRMMYAGQNKNMNYYSFGKQSRKFGDRRQKSLLGLWVDADYIGVYTAASTRFLFHEHFLSGKASQREGKMSFELPIFQIWS